jgi:RimJ/RimL family protein N-acetyltransferase
MAKIAISPPISQSEISRTAPVLLTLNQRPTVADLWPCFAALQDDPTAQHAYSDRMPRTPRAALRLATGPHRWRFWVVAADGQPCGLWFCHDAGLDQHGAYTWIGTYHIAGFRGQCAVDAFRLVRTALALQGLSRVFAACRATNRPAQHFTAACGFVRVGRCPRFAPFHGGLGDVILYALDPMDKAVIWDAAYRRAGDGHDARA